MHEKLYVVANEKSRLRKSKVKFSKSKVKFYDWFPANWVFEPNVHLCFVVQQPLHLKLYITPLLQNKTQELAFNVFFFWAGTKSIL